MNPFGRQHPQHRTTTKEAAVPFPNEQPSAMCLIIDQRKTKTKPTAAATGRNRLIGVDASYVRFCVEGKDQEKSDRRTLAEMNSQS